MLATLPFLFLASLSMNHQPIECFVKDRFPQLDLEVQPAQDATQVRVFFKSARDDDYHYVPMAFKDGRFVGKLPRPKEKAHALTYYIEVASTDGTIRKTPEITAD